MSEYAERKPWDLEPHYIKHVNAMTAEGLHHKAAIAAELAYRDKRIENLEKQLAERDAALARCVEAARQAMVFIRIHHWNDNAPGRGNWDLDAAGKSFRDLEEAIREKYEGK